MGYFLIMLYVNKKKYFLESMKVLPVDIRELRNVIMCCIIIWSSEKWIFYEFVMTWSLYSVYMLHVRTRTTMYFV